MVSEHFLRVRIIYSDWFKNVKIAKFLISFSALVLPLLINRGQKPQKQDLTLEEFGHMISPYDLARLKSYTKNMVEYRLILDLVPVLAKAFFINKVPGLGNLKLMTLQKSILIGIGLQCKTIDKLASELELQSKQLLGQFKEMMRQMSEKIEKAKEDAFRSDLIANGGSSAAKSRPALASLNDELNEVADELKQKQKEAFANDDLSQYKVKGSEEVWSSALSKSKGKLNMISVKTGEEHATEKKSQDEEEVKGKNSKKRKMDIKDKKHKKMKV